MVHHSMDFFNKMHSGFLMSRITNDTRMMQAALSSISSDLFKQPVTIISGVAVLLYMDWKFTIVTLVLFPSCLVPLSIYGKRARKPCRTNRKNGPDGRDDAGNLRRHPRGQVVRARGASGKFVSPQQQLQFDNAMRIIRAMEAIGPLVERSPPSASGLRSFTSISPI